MKSETGADSVQRSSPDKHITMSSILRTALLAFLSLMALPARSSAQVAMAIETYDDLNHPVAGTRVIVDGAIVGVTQVQARRDATTPRVLVPPASAVLVSLAETSTLNGTTLGQTLAEPTPAQGTGTHLFDRRFHQPMIVPTYLTTEVAGPIHAEQHTRWMFQKTRSASRIGFPAEVGMLLTNTEIQALADYNTVSVRAPGSQYTVGLVIRSRGTVNLGQYNLILILDCKGHGLASQPVADCYILRPNGSAPSTPPTFAAEVFGWEDELAFIGLSGSVEPGDNLILISTSAQGHPTLRLATQPPPFVSLPGSGAKYAAQIGGDRSVERDAVALEDPPPCANPTPCNPECPTSVNGICELPTPTSDAGCAAPVVVSTGCGVATKKVEGSLACGNPTCPTTFTVSSTAKGSVNLHIKWSDNVETDASGEYSSTSEMQQTYAYTGGVNGCGECKEMCKFTKLCQQRTRVVRDGWELDHTAPEPEPGGWYRTRVPCKNTSEIETECEIKGTTTVSCSQTDGPG